MKNLPFRARRYLPGAQVVHRPSNRPGMVIAVLPHGQRLVATTPSGRTRVAVSSVVSARDLRREVDLAA